jgi:hypothetical protein
MVYQRYSTYKNVTKLFLPQEVEKFMGKKIKKKSTANIALDDENLDGFILNDIIPEKEGQTLVVFPDLRTLINLTKSDFRENK